jgi:hypothetical protein
MISLHKLPVTCRAYLDFPSCTSATPCSSPKVSSMLRKASMARPSSRICSESACLINSRSLMEISASRGILPLVKGVCGCLSLARRNVCDQNASGGRRNQCELGSLARLVRDFTVPSTFRPHPHTTNRRNTPETSASRIIDS